MEPRWRIFPERRQDSRGFASEVPGIATSGPPNRMRVFLALGGREDGLQTSCKALHAAFHEEMLLC
jgi:hypothetical protein